LKIFLINGRLALLWNIPQSTLSPNESPQLITTVKLRKNKTSTLIQNRTHTPKKILCKKSDGLERTNGNGFRFRWDWLMSMEELSCLQIACVL